MKTTGVAAYPSFRRVARKSYNRSGACNRSPPAIEQSIEAIARKRPMSTLRTLYLSALALLVTTVAQAQPIQPFSMTALKAAQTSGQSVLVDAYASWCPTCRKQAPTIDAISKDPAFAKLLILRLDYDNQTAEKRALGISQQSTLIVYHGAKETGREVGLTDPDQIKTLAKSALP
jgi:thioredoxin 1